MAHPDAEPVPVPERVLLPAPDYQNADSAYWRLTSGGSICAYRDGFIHIPNDFRSLQSIERDALATLAAVRWARGAK